MKRAANHFAGVVAGRTPEFTEMNRVGASLKPGSARLSDKMRDSSHIPSACRLEQFWRAPSLCHCGYPVVVCAKVLSVSLIGSGSSRYSADAPRLMFGNPRFSRRRSWREPSLCQPPLTCVLQSSGGDLVSQWCSPAFGGSGCADVSSKLEDADPREIRMSAQLCRWQRDST